MKVAVLQETCPGENRVALVPANIAALNKAGMEVVVESGAGLKAGYPDGQYRDKGATIVGTRDEAFAADVLLQVRTPAANPVRGTEDLPRLRAGQVCVGLMDPLGTPQAAQASAATGAAFFALELIPRITRAQSMDVLSSMATIAGYRAVLLAAVELPRMLPMLMTAAGTITAARAFIIGVGVAGLQAIATSRRLGAVVQAWDVRADCREQVESLGGKFVDLQLDAGNAQDQGGYAKDLGEEFYRRQRAAMARVVAGCDIVITTAAIPGKPSPLLITADAVAGMQPGSVIIDLAAERGGNCELTKANERILAHGVTILGPTNLPAEIPYHASQMFSNNITKFLLNLVKQGEVHWNLDDEIVRGTLVTRGGEVVHPR
ncbi:MAG: Re/Si-specific NAD(P)(+) transhydrogenase subunit alpha, partial [Pirellulaceae bacterium]